MEHFVDRVYYKARYFSGYSSEAMPAEVWLEGNFLMFRYISHTGAENESWDLDKIQQQVSPQNAVEVLVYGGYDIDEHAQPSLEIISENFSEAFLRRSPPKSLATKSNHFIAKLNTPLVLILMAGVVVLYWLLRYFIWFWI